MRLVMGYTLGNMVGILLGLLTGRIHWMRDSVGQVMNFLRATPFIVLIPLAILWFGIGEVEKVFLVTWGVAFPVWLNTQAGLSEVETEYIWAAQSLGVRGWRIYRDVFLPSALPFIVAGARIGIATGIFALAAAEMAGAFEGLAFRVFYSHQMFQTEKMMAGIVTLGCFGFLLDRLAVLGIRFLLPWWRERRSAER